MALVPQEDVEKLYTSHIRFEVVESLLHTLNTETRQAVELLRFSRYHLLRSLRYETQFLALDFANILVETGVSLETATLVESCFEKFLDFNQYIDGLALENLEMALIKQNVVNNAEL